MPPDSRRPLPLLGRALPGVFYGWVNVAGASLLSFVVVGVGFYCLAVLLDGLCQERGWPRTSVALATTLYFVTTGAIGSLVGRWVDRRGPRAAFAAGAPVMGAALLWIGRIERPEQLYLAYPLLAVGFAMAGAVPANALVTRWFVASRARAMSVAQTGVSVGGVVLVPVSTALLLERGVAYTTASLALLVVSVVWLVTALVVRSHPEPFGLRPDDGALPDARLQPALDPEQQRRVWTWRAAMATRAFWIAVAAFAGILFCQVATAMHQISLLRERIDPGDASLAVSTTAFGSIVARLAVGRFADRWSKRHLGAALMLVQASALLLFASASRPALLFAASFVFGCTIGNLFMLQSLVVGELFGMVSFGTVFGMLQLLTQTLSGLGPYGLSLLVEALGSYRAALLVLAGLAALSALVLLRLRPPEPAR